MDNLLTSIIETFRQYSSDLWARDASTTTPAAQETDCLSHALHASTPYIVSDFERLSFTASLSSYLLVASAICILLSTLTILSRSASWSLHTTKLEQAVDAIAQSRASTDKAIINLSAKNAIILMEKDIMASQLLEKEIRFTRDRDSFQQELAKQSLKAEASTAALREQLLKAHGLVNELQKKASQRENDVQGFRNTIEQPQSALSLTKENKPKIACTSSGVQTLTLPVQDPPPSSEETSPPPKVEENVQEIEQLEPADVDAVQPQVKVPERAELEVSLLELSSGTVEEIPFASDSEQSEEAVTPPQPIIQDLPVVELPSPTDSVDSSVTVTPLPETKPASTTPVVEATFPQGGLNDSIWANAPEPAPSSDVSTKKKGRSRNNRAGQSGFSNVLAGVVNQSQPSKAGQLKYAEERQYNDPTRVNVNPEKHDQFVHASNMKFTPRGTPTSGSGSYDPPATSKYHRDRSFNLNDR